MKDKAYKIIGQRDFEGFKQLVLAEDSSYIRKGNVIYWHDELNYSWTESERYFNECKQINFLVKGEKK